MHDFPSARFLQAPALLLLPTAQKAAARSWGVGACSAIGVVRNLRHGRIGVN
jgi:hypothetical protein